MTDFNLTPKRREQAIKAMTPMGMSKRLEDDFINIYHQTAPYSVESVEEDEKENFASATIQRIVRGFIQRRRFMKCIKEQMEEQAFRNHIPKDKKELLTVSDWIKETDWYSNALQHEIDKVKASIDTREKSALVIQRVFRQYLRRKSAGMSHAVTTESPSDLEIVHQWFASYLNERPSVDKLLRGESGLKSGISSPRKGEVNYEYKMTVLMEEL